MSKDSSSNNKLFFIDETETEESTHNGNECFNLPNSYGAKKSITCFPSKIFLEEPNSNMRKRKYTLEPSLEIQNFVPHPKPLEIHFVPSKLRLNKKGFKDLKINQSNKVLIESNNYYISCPGSDNSDSSDEDDQYLNLRNKNTMKDMRKDMTKQKKSIPKVLSKQIVNTNGIQDSNEEGSLYSNEEDDEYVLSGMNDDIKRTMSLTDKPKESRTNRLNSCSILQILESSCNI